MIISISSLPTYLPTYLLKLYTCFIHVMSHVFQTPNPKPQTPNPKPQTPNPKP